MYIKADKDGIKRTTNKKSWRLVHDGIRVMLLEESDSVGITGGDTEIFIADSKEKCDAEIAKLGLFVKPTAEETKVG
jgi:hypothetical protein